MGRYGKSLRVIVGEISQSGHRSTLFWWLVEHHDEIAAAAIGRRLRWGALCGRFAEAGLADLSGKPASPETARRTWHRARQMVAEARERQTAEAAKPRRAGATPPSRLPKDWMPEAFRQPAVANTTVVALPPFAPAGAPALNTLPAPVAPPGAASDPMSKEARSAMVPAGMPAWTAPQGDFVKPDQSPAVQAKLLRLEATFRQADRYLGPPIKRRDD
jgi:hypothetical protein